MRFFQEVLQSMRWDYVTVGKHFEPKDGFICFFNHNACLRNPLGLRLRSTRSPVICSHGSTAAEQLLPKNLSITAVRK